LQKKKRKKRSKNKNEVKRLSNPFGRFATGPTTTSDANNPVVERELVKRHFPRCKVPAISTGEMHPADASVPRRQTQTTIDFELTRNFDAPERERERERREEKEGAESETGDEGGGLENTDHGETSAEAKREREREKGNIHRREDEERNGGERRGAEEEGSEEGTRHSLQHLIDLNVPAERFLTF
ncbi:hypothetical protein ALC60_12116, partial [Trachymyrmex zeteki]